MATSTHDEPKARDIWFILMVISAIFTIIVGLLEAFGVWHDLGVGLGFAGFGATLLFGMVSLQGATRAQMRAIDSRLDQMHDTMRHMLIVLNRLVDIAEKHWR